MCRARQGYPSILLRTGSGLGHKTSILPEQKYILDATKLSTLYLMLIWPEIKMTAADISFQRSGPALYTST